MKKSKILIFILVFVIMMLSFSVNVAATTWSYMFTNLDFTKITSDYSTSHKGIDIISKSSTSINGASIRAVFSGKVAYKYNHDPNLPNTGNNSAGNYVVIINTAETHKAGFMHMTNPCSLNLNASVTTSTILGTVGSTGQATGPHLHHTVHSGTSNWATSSTGVTAVYDPKDFYNVTFSY